MQCQYCKKNTATIHLTELSDGQRNESHLCEVCARKHGLTVKNQVPINELLSTLLSVQSQAGPTDDTASQHKSCPHCGITFEQFRRQSLLGCGNDYEVFGDLLLPIIKQAHAGSTTHCGKTPAKAPKDTEKHTMLQSLRQKLDIAIHKEDYETAAKLRDRIKKLNETD